MKVQEAIKDLREYADSSWGGLNETFNMAIEALMGQCVCEQIKWERDIALSQLEEIGLGLGEKTDRVREALGKQTPKKPQMRHIKSFDGYNDGWCPCCGSYVQESEYDKKYCQECGQALDWKVE